MDNQDQALDDDELAVIADRLVDLPPDTAAWVDRLWREVHRLRALVNAAPSPASGQKPAEPDDDSDLDEHVAQVALDTAEWLKTLWDVGYMGAGSFRAEPRTNFPNIDLEDVRRSSLFARIRQGKHALPFPPPTRQGLPWHELVEDAVDRVPVNAEVIRDETGALLGAIIEGCADWDILEEVSDNHEFIVQHQSKGPKYRLTIDHAFLASLHREPPQTVCAIHLRDHGGLTSYTLDWPEKNGRRQLIPLRAATWGRATAEADYWLATTHPEMYGQVRFDKHVD